MTDPVQATAALRSTDLGADTANPGAPAVALSALRTVLAYTVTDAFALDPEEIFWFRYKIEEVTRPLVGAEAAAVALAARHEMLTGYYSNLLAAAEANARTVPAFDRTVSQPTVDDWGQVLMDIIRQGYQMRPLVESTMLGAITGLLRELGVGHHQTPRAARYLPNDMRQRLQRQSAETAAAARTSRPTR